MKLVFLSLLFGIISLGVQANDERRLKMNHTHRTDTIDVVFFRDGEFDSEAIDQLSHFLRDWRTDEEIHLDPELFNILWELQQLTGSSGTYEIISGYRSEATNAKLREMGRGVALKSQHVLGKAIDVRLTDVATSDLRNAALQLARGGVGYYPQSNFVHVDTGRVRRW